ncbi:vacuolar iron transporter homolog 2 isoform X1 [Ziziphus jujuba]|uniref:Vacuolar iron transporter n=2 Tax=Ziziphus jujuba TaxID=326968 RepID=A0A6P6GE84_ZIZJJ|nr:vacuolar iron transporter homolog 2 isoform X1 [Ziziphus jujuba]KAH7519789.1 hypothetical protein FEM48_Zijuj08G0074400 [Ziziphus jujuba var. spinosa]
MLMASQTLSCAEHTLPVTVKIHQTTVQVERAQWLRAAILGASDGLLSTTSLMLGVGAVDVDRWSMILSGVAGAVAGACSMAVGEFVSVSTQKDIEMVALTHCSALKADPSQAMSVISEEGRTTKNNGVQVENNNIRDSLPNPHKAAAASALAFLCGSLIPLASTFFVAKNTARIVIITIVTSIALAVFGGVAAHVGGSPVRISAVRVLVGGWLAMAVTFSLLKPFQRDEHGT